MATWGILSTARINDSILAAAHKSDQVNVLAVASRDQKRAITYARNYGIDRAYGSYDDLLADPDIEVVYISLPNNLHIAWSVRALRAGKHVLCEKPLSRDPHDVELAFEAARKANRLLIEGFMYRYHPQTRRILDVISQGTLGKLRTIRSSFRFPLNQQDAPELSLEREGGALMHLGCYCVHGSRLIAGEPLSVRAHQVLCDTGTDLEFRATMQLPGDVVAEFEASFCQPLYQELELIGEKGSLHAAGPWKVDWGGGTIQLHSGDADRNLNIEFADAYQLELEAVSTAIGSGNKSVLDEADAVAQSRILQALFLSADQDRDIMLSAQGNVGDY